MATPAMRVVALKSQGRIVLSSDSDWDFLLGLSGSVGQEGAVVVRGLMQHGKQAFGAPTAIQATLLQATCTIELKTWAQWLPG